MVSLPMAQNYNAESSMAKKSLLQLQKQTYHLLCNVNVNSILEMVSISQQHREPKLSTSNGNNV
jgi:hypothetical protein